MQPTSREPQRHTGRRIGNEKFPYDPSKGSFVYPPERRCHPAEAFRYRFGGRDAAVEHRTLLTLQPDDGAGKQGAWPTFSARMCQPLLPLTTGNQASIQMPGDPVVKPMEMTKRHMAGVRMFPSRVPQRGQILDVL